MKYVIFDGLWEICHSSGEIQITFFCLTLLPFKKKSLLLRMTSEVKLRILYIKTSKFDISNMYLNNVYLEGVFLLLPIDNIAYPGWEKVLTFI